MKSGWRTKAIGDLCVIKPPKSEAKAELAPTDLVSFVPMEDLPSGSKNLSPSRERPFSEVVGSYTYFAEGDVLLAKITPCFENGKLGIAKNLSNGVGFGSSEYIVLRPDSTLSNEWLYYYLSRDTFRAEGASRMAGAVGHKRISQEFVARYPIPIPPMAEQKRIVALLDQAFEAIDAAAANTATNVQNADDLFFRALDDALSKRNEGWVESTVGEEFSFIDYRGKTPHKVKEGLRLITAKNVKMGFVQREPEEFVAPKTYESWMTRGIPQVGDVLFTTEAPLGNVAQLDTDEKVVFAQRIIILQPTRLDGEFAKYLLMSPTVQRRIHAKGTGATVKGIKASLLKTVPIEFPRSPSEQRRMAARLRGIKEASQKLHEIGADKEARLGRLRQSILSEAFGGRL